jgi:hypothetical protein
MKLALATHQASIATVTQMTDGWVWNFATILDDDGSETFGDYADGSNLQTCCTRLWRSSTK